MASKVLQAQLSNGFQMPMIGLGTYAYEKNVHLVEEILDLKWLHCTAHMALPVKANFTPFCVVIHEQQGARAIFCKLRQATPGQYRQAVEHAIDVGYRHIDTASCYNNEEEVGEGIRNKIKAGVVRREELFVTTKLWNDSHATEDVIPALRQSLARLQLDYVDLYLIHWPVSVNSHGVDTGVDYLDTWRGMEAALKQGLAKSIGVSNFNEEQLERLLKTCGDKPVCNQFEINPTLTQNSLVELCKRHAVLPAAYTPLGLISEARPEFIGKDDIKTDPRLGELAAKHGKTRAQIALRYLVQRGIPALPKSFTPARIEENLNVFDFQLSEQDMQVVESYNIDHRCVPGTAFKDFKYYPF